MKKTIFTLDVGDYEPEITEITFPFMRFYANKIGADFVVLKERRFPEWPILFEEFQIRDHFDGLDWAIFMDADTFVHPECIDYTMYIPEGTVCPAKADMGASIHHDETLVKGGSVRLGGFLTIAPKECFGIWDLPEESLEEILEKCTPTMWEARHGMNPRHMPEEFVLSRNIAKYGYKVMPSDKINAQLGLPGTSWFWHKHVIPNAQKVHELKELLWELRIPHPVLSKGWEWFYERAGIEGSKV